ncbi:hypothetical protein GCM10009680_87440 [Streptomyces yatensis]|uniref:Uncharacterized protein n=1 Tax=Streptomyces yatensis TaxID=155177 RepID=A0ABN2JNJ3_9ACTN
MLRGSRATGAHIWCFSLSGPSRNAVFDEATKLWGGMPGAAKSYGYHDH